MTLIVESSICGESWLKQIDERLRVSTKTNPCLTILNGREVAEFMFCLPITIVTPNDGEMRSDRAAHPNLTAYAEARISSVTEAVEAFNSEI